MMDTKEFDTTQGRIAMSYEGRAIVKIAKRSQRIYMRIGAISATSDRYTILPLGKTAFKPGDKVNVFVRRDVIVVCADVDGTSPEEWYFAS